MNLPSANVIPDKLINAKVYMEGSSALLGVADIELHDGDSYAFTYTK